MMLKINTNFKRGIGWSLAILAISGLFSYLTFIPAQTFADSLIVDPNENRSLSQISTMQEMSQQICINSRENETKQLEDVRDRTNGKISTGTTYWVTKLKDGNCWMVQNLDYNGGGNSQNPSWSYDNNAARYYDPGDYYYTTPTVQNNCGYEGVYTLESCITKGWATSGDKHCHVGNYYSWNAAMAGMTNATGIIQGICPDGWYLPANGSTNITSFKSLFTAYGVGTGMIVGDQDSRLAPFYLLYGGHITSDGIVSAGNDGGYWTSSGSSSSASNMTFGTTLNLSSSSVRYPGYNIRCYATGGWLDSYPDPTPDVPLQDDQSSVSIQVSPIINLDVTKSADDMVVDFNSIDTSTIDINVSSNQKYQVTLTTNQPSLIPHKSDNSEYSIKMVGASGGVVEKGKNGWGIKKKLSATNDNNLGSLVNEPTYSPIGINNDQVTFYRSAGPEALTNQTDPANPLQLEVGVSVDQSLPSDTYSTMVTVTAMAY